MTVDYDEMVLRAGDDGISERLVRIDVLKLVGRCRELEAALEFEMGNSSSQTERERAEEAEARVKELEARIVMLREALEEIKRDEGCLEVRVATEALANLDHGAEKLLARLKELEDVDRLWTEALRKFKPLTEDYVAEKLLARLKAAEAVCGAASNAYDTIMTKAYWNAAHFDTLYSALEAWRRAGEEK